jgi:hypothetical protein
LVEDPMLKVRKFKNSVREASGQKEIYIRRILLKLLKGEAGVILIGLEFWKFEGKNCHIE